MSEPREAQALLERLLSYAGTKQDPAVLSQALLRQFGSLQRVLMSEMDTLMQVDGLNRQAAILLHLTGQLACRTPECDRLLPLKTTAQLAEYLRPYFAFVQAERVCVLVLDQQRCPIQCVILQDGASDTVLVPSEPLLRTIRHSSAAFCVMAHSHLSGSPHPSSQDVDAARQLAWILSAAGVPLLDHLVFADGAYQSMAELGLLSEEQAP